MECSIPLFIAEAEESEIPTSATKIMEEIKELIIREMKTRGYY